MTQTFPEHPNGQEPDLNALAAFVDGRLDADERARVTEHLSRCAQCRAIISELARGRGGAIQRATFRPALPLAATLLIAVIGGGVYWLARPARFAPAPPVPEREAEPGRPALPPSPPEEAPSPPGRVATPTPRNEPPDTTRAVGTRSVGGKMFTLVAGEWIDTSYRPTDFLPVVDIKSRQELNARSELHPFIRLGSHFVVVVNNTVYRVALPASER